jgi:2-polyprenyl-6-methoxyphenol hydroxylase-like FAD-dependent oxidoreductase
MRHTDVAIVGGGLAGSLAAAMLGRASIDTVLIDPHPIYPPDFRCEKLDETQLQTLRLTHLAAEVFNASTPYRESWTARFGYVVEKQSLSARGILYDTLVNTVRGQIPRHTDCIKAKVTNLLTGPERQVVELSNGDTISARLVVMATGLNAGLRSKLGIGDEIISADHSISAGFDVVPMAGRSFPFSALTYFAERPSDQMAYLALFPVGTSLRANLFGYRNLHDPWLRQFREAPQETLYAMWPRLRHLMGNFAVPGRIQIRPVNLYVTNEYRRDGVVLVGDAFSTSCPAAGTGARKVLVDVERLCNVHIPHWLATPGMAKAKTNAFYDDPMKQACDALCIEKALSLRSFSTDLALRWAALRWAKFFGQWGRGILRRMAARSPTVVGESPSLLLWTRR